MLRTLVKDSAVYAVGTIASRLVGFIMIPVYTRVLTPADYGIIETIIRLVDIIGLLLSLGLAEALLRHYYLAKTDEERNRLIGTVLNLNLLVVIGGILVFYPLSPWMTRLAFGHDRYTHYVAVSLAAMMIGSLIELPLTLWRAEGKAWRFTAISLLKLLTQLGTNIVLVVWLRWAVWGVVMSSFLNAALWSAVLGVLVRLRYGSYFDKRWLRPVLRYGLPLVPASLSLFILNFGDRFFLTRYASTSELGLYSLAYRFAMLVSTFYGVVSLAWGPWAFRVGEMDDGGLHIRRATALVLLTFAAISSGIALMSLPAVRLMSAPSFWEAADYVPALAFGYWLFVAQAPLSVGIRLARRTEYLTMTNGFSAATCLALSFLLIPRYGVWGAVWTTVISFAVLATVIFAVAQSVYPIRHDWAAVAIAVLIAAVPMMSNMVTLEAFWSDLIMRVSLIVFCIGLVGGYAARMRTAQTNPSLVAQNGLLPKEHRHFGNLRERLDCDWRNET